MKLEFDMKELEGYYAEEYPDLFRMEIENAIKEVLRAVVKKAIAKHEQRIMDMILISLEKCTEMDGAIQIPPIEFRKAR